MNKFFCLLLCLCLSACATLGLQKPQVSVVDIKPVASSLLEQNFDLVLRLQNPNRLPLSATGLSFDLRVNGQQLASAVSKQGIQLPALGETTIQLRLHTTLLGWLKQMGAVMQGNGQLDYQLQGKLEGLEGLGDLPFSSTGEWKLP